MRFGEAYLRTNNLLLPIRPGHLLLHLSHHPATHSMPTAYAQPHRRRIAIQSLQQPGLPSPLLIPHMPLRLHSTLLHHLRLMRPATSAAAHPVRTVLSMMNDAGAGREPTSAASSSAAECRSTHERLCAAIRCGPS